MKYEDLLIELKKHDFNYKPYIHLAIDNEEIREQLIKNIVEDNHINIYYNSYYLIDEASKQCPELFYQYWDCLVPLFDYKNSYHRNISHWIITNLIKVDKNNKFDLIKKRYFGMIKDEKFLTGLMALRDIIIMTEYRNDLKEEIINFFLDKTLIENYKENQISKIQYEILEYFGKVYYDSKNKNKIISYIKDCLDSKSIKTRKLAKTILNEFETNTI